MRNFESVSQELKKNEGKTMLPLRGTRTSAGYDFYTPVDLVIAPQEKVFFWTDVKANMQEGEVLLLDVRSSLGTKQDVMLANTIPVIDSDYVQAKNGGNIGIMLRNLKPSMKLDGYQHIEYDVILVGTMGEQEELMTDENGRFVTQKDVIAVPNIIDLTEQNTVFIPKGERVCQGIFVKFEESENCNTEVQRTGGFGSTNEVTK